MSSKQHSVLVSHSTLVGTIKLPYTSINTLTPGNYSIVLHEARAGLAPCLLVRIRCRGRRIWRSHCLWDTTRSRHDRELASAFHYRGSVLRVTLSVVGSFDTVLGHSCGSPRCHRSGFPARSTRNDEVFHGGRAEACFGSCQLRYQWRYRLSYQQE